MSRRFGFTLVELILGIVVVGILSTAGLFGYRTWQGRTYKAVLVSDLKRFAVEEEQVRGTRGLDSLWAFTANPNLSLVTRLSRPAYYYMALRHVPTDQTCWILMRPDRARGNGVPYCDADPVVADTLTPGQDTLFVAALAAPDSVPVGTPVTLDGSGSFSNSTPITEYAFTGLGGADQTGLLTTLTTTFGTIGDRVVTLTVRNGSGQVRTATRTLRVVATTPPPPTAPTASFTAPDTVEVGAAAALDGSASTAGAGRTLVTYTFSGWAGGPLTGVTQTVTFPTPGTRVLTLTVTDDQGTAGSTTRSVVVLDTTLVPVFTAPATIEVNQPVVLDGSASQVAAGRTITDYRFSGGGLGVLSGPATQTVTFSSIGDQVVTLTVFDNQGRSRQVTRTITVTATAPASPVSYTLTAVPDSIGIGGLTRVRVAATTGGLPAANIAVSLATANPDRLTAASSLAGATDPDGLFEASFTGVADGNALITLTAPDASNIQTVVRVRAVAPQVPVLIPVTALTQGGRPSRAVATPPVVAVLDSATWAPMAGVTLTFATGGTGGTVSFLSNTTDASGEATSGTWTLGATPWETYEVLATIPGQSVTFSALAEDGGNAPEACLTLTPTQGPGGTTVTASCGCSTDPDGQANLDVCIFTGLPGGSQTIPYSPTASVTFPLPTPPRPRAVGSELPRVRVNLEVRDLDAQPARTSGEANVTVAGAPTQPTSCVLSWVAPGSLTAWSPQALTVVAVGPTFLPLNGVVITTSSSGVAATLSPTPDVTDASGELPVVVRPDGLGTITLTATASCASSTITRPVDPPTVTVNWIAPDDTIAEFQSVPAIAQLFSPVTGGPIQGVTAGLIATTGDGTVVQLTNSVYGTVTTTDLSGRVTDEITGLAPGTAVLQATLDGTPVGATKTVVVATRPSDIAYFEFVGWLQSAGGLATSPVFCQQTGGCANRDFYTGPTDEPPAFYPAGTTVPIGYRFVARNSSDQPVANARVQIQLTGHAGVYTGPGFLTTNGAGEVDVPLNSIELDPSVTGVSAAGLTVSDPRQAFVATQAFVYASNPLVCARIESGIERGDGSRYSVRPQGATTVGRLVDCDSRTPVGFAKARWVTTVGTAVDTSELLTADAQGILTRTASLPPAPPLDLQRCLVPEGAGVPACLDIITARFTGGLWQWGYNPSEQFGFPFGFTPPLVANVPISSIVSVTGVRPGDLFGGTYYGLGTANGFGLCRRPSDNVGVASWTPPAVTASVRLVTQQVLTGVLPTAPVSVACSAIPLLTSARRHGPLEYIDAGTGQYVAVYDVCRTFDSMPFWTNGPTMTTPPIPSPTCDVRRFYVRHTSVFNVDAIECRWDTCLNVSVVGATILSREDVNP